jgi:hypothetical protein
MCTPAKPGCRADIRNSGTLWNHFCGGQATGARDVAAELIDVGAGTAEDYQGGDVRRKSCRQRKFKAVHARRCGVQAAGVIASLQVHISLTILTSISYKSDDGKDERLHSF